MQETVIENRQKLDLSQIDFIDTEECILIFGLFKTDEGILTKDSKTFFCILTMESFVEMVRLLEPFCRKESKGYQYLYDVDSPTYLLFAPAAN